MTPAPNRPMRIAAPEPFELWRIALDDMPDAEATAELSDDERARAARFVFERHRRRFLAAHSGLRRLLAARVGQAPAALRYELGPFGKPRLAGRPALAFNMSHSEDVALVALADGGEIGVDVEVRREVSRTIGLAERHFTPGEQAELAAAAVEARDLAFLSGWTRKEACLKAIGSGLSIAPEAFHAGLGPQWRRLRIDAHGVPAELEVTSVPAGEDVVVALSRVLTAGFRIPAAAKNL